MRSTQYLIEALFLILATGPSLSLALHPSIAGAIADNTASTSSWSVDDILGSWLVLDARSQDPSPSPVETGATVEIPIPGVPAAAGGSSRGWLERWMALGGEGEVVVELSSGNLTYPHRPAAFPTHLPAISRLPKSGLLVAFTSLPNSTLPTSAFTAAAAAGISSGWLFPGSGSGSGKPPKTPPAAMQGCLPAAWPPIRWTSLAPVYRRRGAAGQERGITEKGVKVVLVERGGCDFATKVQAAQERGAGAVIVGDRADEGESVEEGKKRTGGLITMFSPEDTDNIHIPSVFVSRAAYLQLLDVLDSASGDQEGVWIDIGDGADENATLGGMLSFALLMPSLFLLATIAVHRVRVARQKEQDRAPAQVVLSLPERVWQPDIVWEKEDDTPLVSPSRPDPPSRTPSRKASTETSITSSSSPARPSASRTPSSSSSGLAPPPISSRDIITPPAVEIADPFNITPTATPTASGSGSGSTSSRPPAKRTKSNSTITAAVSKKRRYFSKDECAICMDEFHAGDIVRILPCGHVFHKEECDEWLMKWRKLCPTCRADVTLPPGATPPAASRGARLTLVDGLGHGMAGAGAEVEQDADDRGERLEGPIFTAGRFLGRWIGRTRGMLFGRRGQAGDAAMLGERTALIRRGSGVERRGEGSV